MIIRFLVLFIFIYPIAFLGNATAIAQVQLVSITEVDALMQKAPQPMIVFLTAPWCSYCTLQKIQLQKIPQTTSVYWVEFDVETTQEVVFNKKTYKNQKNNLLNKKGKNELAYFLNQQQPIVLPTVLFIDRSYNVQYIHKGFLKAEELLKIQAYALKKEH